MDILGIQIASVTFSISLIYLSYLYYKRGYFEIYSLLAWLGIFCLVIFFTLFPKILTPFATIFKVARLFDLFVILGMLLLLTLAYINFVQHQGLKKKLEKLIQKNALKEDSEKENQSAHEDKTL